MVYISRSLVGADQNALAAILHVSAKRNAVSGVTGMLWWSATSFAQVLEGDRAAVRRTYQRIEGDPRHADIDIVDDRTIARRLFGNWSMRQADDEKESTEATAFLIGLAGKRKTSGARRLAAFLMEADG